MLFSLYRTKYEQSRIMFGMFAFLFGIGVKIFTLCADRYIMKTGSSLLLILVLATSIFSCKKEDLSKFKFNPKSLTGAQCSNSKPVSEVSPYRRLAFSDSFEPGSSGDPCYSQKPSCDLRLDWWMSGSCPKLIEDYSGIKDLNKCIWKVWHGYSYWATNKQLTFDGRAVEVKNGRLILKILPNPDYDSSKGNCGDKGPNEFALNYYNTNCKLIGGAVDSTDYAPGNSRGVSALYGRIEMKARYVHTTPSGGAFPAFWMWPNPVGKGTPHTTTVKPDYAGEIDILEMDNAANKNNSLQTYHNWRDVKPGISAAVGHGFDLNASDDHVYGVEWSPTSLKWYIDDCYITEVKQGQLSTHGDIGVPMQISKTPSFLMLWQGALGWHLDLNNTDRLEVDEVRIYE